MRPVEAILLDANYLASHLDEKHSGIPACACGGMAQLLASNDTDLTMTSTDTFDPPLDPGIRTAVEALRSAGVETFESCEGGSGHAYPEPTIRFHGDRPEGFKALAAAMHAGLVVAELRRIWPVIDGEPTGPYWELTFMRRP